MTDYQPTTENAVKCKRCDSEFNFTSRSYIVEFLKRPFCNKCKHIPDDKMEDFKAGKYVKNEHTCIRCGHKKIFNSDYYKKAIKSTRCRDCKSVPDSLLKYYKSEKMITICKCCNQPIIHLNRKKYAAAIYYNNVCFKCDVKDILYKIERYLKNPSLSTKNKNAIKSQLTIAKKLYWRKITGAGKRDVLRQLKSAFNKVKFFHNMRKEDKQTYYTRLKLSFEKYKGDNHWTKRPDVLQKIVDSCAKYKGENHWFHCRPASLQKLRLTWKLKTGKVN